MPTPTPTKRYPTTIQQRSLSLLSDLVVLAAARIQLLSPSSASPSSSSYSPPPCESSSVSPRNNQGRRSSTPSSPCLTTPPYQSCLQKLTRVRRRCTMPRLRRGTSWSKCGRIIFRLAILLALGGAVLLTLGVAIPLSL